MVHTVNLAGVEILYIGGYFSKAGAFSNDRAVLSSVEPNSGTLNWHRGFDFGYSENNYVFERMDIASDTYN